MEKKVISDTFTADINTVFLYILLADLFSFIKTYNKKLKYEKILQLPIYIYCIAYKHTIALHMTCKLENRRIQSRSEILIS